jgi:glyoxylase-like metal-dependent hydrolase (beta-lactamase superfamily II)
MSESTHASVSVDSGTHWTEPGAWRVSASTYRIPLPLPNDGLRAVNVYAVVGDDGLTMIDGGWALDASRNILGRSLKTLGFGVADIRRFFVTHAHRDHYTQAVALRREIGAEVWIGGEERPTFAALATRSGENPHIARLLAAGAPGLAREWQQFASGESQLRADWESPDRWFRDGRVVQAGDRTLTAVATPGHTRGHYVFADTDAGDLFAGDHVLPTITPSIGFEAAPTPLPLREFIGSLQRVRHLPDARLLPAHGPIAPSVHARVDDLLQHHDKRLKACLAAVVPGGVTSADVAAALTWTRHQYRLQDLDPFNAGLAVLETRAHLDLLALREELVAEDMGGVVVYQPVV